MACSTHLQTRNTGNTCAGGNVIPACQVNDLRGWLDQVYAFNGTSSYVAGDFNLRPNDVTWNSAFKFPSSTWLAGDRNQNLHTHQYSGGTEKIDWAWYRTTAYSPDPYGAVLNMNTSDHHLFITYK